MLIYGESNRFEHNDMRWITWITAAQCSKFEFCPAYVEIVKGLISERNRKNE